MRRFREDIMSNRRKALVSIVALACLVLAPAAFSAPAAAANVGIHLWGNSTGGWGLSNSTIKSPGPHLTFTLGDNVTIVLNGTDGRSHNFYVDYNNDSAVSPGEPSSPTFRTNALTWNFTANKNGTFVYRSSSGRDASMWGNITILPQGAAGGPSLIAGNTVLIVAVIVVAFVGALAVAALVARRKRGTPPPPTEP
jgi:hypothetical protein